MGHSLSTQSVAELKSELLDEGNIAGLLELNRSMFGSMVMQEGSTDDADDADGDDADDDDEDDEDDGEVEDSAKSKEAARLEELRAENKRRRLKSIAQVKQIKDLQSQIDALSKGAPKEKEAEAGNDSSQLQSDRDALLAANEQLRVENAFMASKKFAWKNPKAALRLVDLSEVEINERGEVDGLDEALAALAESDPYLLETKVEKEDPKEKRPPAGQPTGTRKKGTPDREALLNKYPALRR